MEGLTMTHTQSSGAPAPRAEAEPLGKWLTLAAALAGGAAFFDLLVGVVPGWPQAEGLGSGWICLLCSRKSRRCARSSAPITKSIAGTSDAGGRAYERGASSKFSLGPGLNTT